MRYIIVETVTDGSIFKGMVITKDDRKGTFLLDTETGECHVKDPAFDGIDWLLAMRQLLPSKEVKLVA